MFTLSEIAERLGGEVRADNGVVIRQVASLSVASANQISFLTDASYLESLKKTAAGAVVVAPCYADETDLPRIVTENTYAYYAQLAALLNPELTPAAGVAATASLASDVFLGAEVHVAEHAVIANKAVLSDGVIVGAGCFIGEGVEIGAGTRLSANVVIYHGCRIGANCIIHSGTVIGADGFGYAEQQERWVKIPQIGRVIIGNDVEIGANTTIDRGALDDTVIEDGVKLDNLIQIGHNCRIGAHTAIAGCTGVAGSAIIGKHCKIGGAAMILGHLEITDHVTISPGSMITRSVVRSGTYTALMPFQLHSDWKKTAAYIRRLNGLFERIVKLESLTKAKRDPS